MFITEQTYELLKKVRVSTTLELSPSPMFKKEIVGLDGETRPFNLRYYQKQGIFHLLSVPRILLGDSTGVGKCCHGDTLLTTTQGLLPIRDLAPEGALIPGTFYEPSKQIAVWTGSKWAKVKRFYWSGSNPTIKITTKNGYQIEGTHIHPLLVVDTSGHTIFKKMHDIQVSDILCMDTGYLKKTPPEEKSSSTHYSYDSVASIEYSTAETMDIEVDDPDHCFVGNGFINHNTIQAIGAMCYLWSGKDSHLKVIVVSPKSAVRQWEGEIAKFTTGVTTFVATGTPQARKKAYDAWKAAPVGLNRGNVLIMGYGSLRGDWVKDSTVKKLPNGTPDPKAMPTPGLFDALTEGMDNLLVIYDECFTYHTPVYLADGTTEIIGKIVCQEKPVEVLTWNFERQIVEAKKVVRWIKKPLDTKNPKALLKIKFEFAGTTNVTPSHNFFKPDGEKITARRLKIGDETICLVTNAPSKDQENVIFGGLLGDSSVAAQHCIWGVSFGQSTKQEKYLLFKREILKNLGVSEVNYYQTEMQSGNQQMIRFRLDGNAYITERLKTWGVRDQGRKTLTTEFLDNIGPLGLAIWYGDDGSLSTKISKGVEVHRIILNTQGFTKHENELLAAWLRWKWGVKAKVTRCYNKKRSSTYYYLYLPRDASKIFLDLMPGALPGVEYKFPGKKVIDITSIDCTPRQVAVKDKVRSKNYYTPIVKPNLETYHVYDIEVEDNHNYFANGTLVSNCTAFKSNTTKTWEVCQKLSARSQRVIGMTATLLKNTLMEGFCIYKAIMPFLFKTKTKFIEDFCHTEMQRISGGRKIPIVVGYKNLDNFRSIIDPYFLGRAKHEISSELPDLITKEIICDLSPAEDAKYSEALNGVLELGDGEWKEYQDTVALTALIYCQEIANSLHLLKFKEGDEIDLGILDDIPSVKVKDLSAKEEMLVDLFEGELEGQKTIIYTRFEKLVGRLQGILQNIGIESVRITGRENEKTRYKNQQAFQDTNSKTQVVLITDAGSEAINLQAASATVFVEAPWSWGTYVQLLGRSQRIGSIHELVNIYHLVARRSEKYKDRRTIDHHALKTLRKKMNLSDKVLGVSTVGALNFTKEDTGNSIRDLVNSMKGKG